MMYPFLTLEDKTEIVHSEMLADGRVKVYLEKPDENDGFHHAICYMPKTEWTEITRFSDDEMTRYRKILKIDSYRVYFCSNESDPLELVHVR